MSPLVPSTTRPGSAVNVSQMLAPLPSSCAAPSIWYDAVLVPKRKPGGRPRSRPSSPLLLLTAGSPVRASHPRTPSSAPGCARLGRIIAYRGSTAGAVAVNSPGHSARGGRRAPESSLVTHPHPEQAAEVRLEALPLVRRVGLLDRRVQQGGEVRPVDPLEHHLVDVRQGRLAERAVALGLEVVVGQGLVGGELALVVEVVVGDREPRPGVDLGARRPAGDHA